MSTRITEAMVADWRKKLSAIRSQVYGPTSQRALEEMCVEIPHAISTESGEADGWPKECATEGCGRAVAIYFQRGGVGSYYCCDCYKRIQALPAAPTSEGSHHG